MRNRCPHEQCGVRAGETWDWRSADFGKRHRGIVVPCRALDARFFVVDFEMPWRIGVNNGIASIARERTVLVTGCGQPLDAFGTARFSLARSDLLCRLENFPFAPRNYLALVLLRQHCHVRSRR